VATGKKNAVARNAVIAFIDESGVMMAPLLQRTWSPRGRTPVLQQRGRHRTKVSAIAAVVLSTHLRRARLYFRLHPNANIQKPKLIAFLRQLRRHTKRAIVIVWDRLNGHRSPEVATYAQRHRITLELLPAYAPELNPVEYAWSYLKTKPLANFAPHELAELTATTHTSARKIQRRPEIVRSFVNQSPLFF
jgi:transposase